MRKRQTSRFRPSEGVSCEGCHGPDPYGYLVTELNTARSDIKACTTRGM